MTSRAGRVASSAARWLIAVLGIAWVVSNLHWRDRVLVMDDRGVNRLPVERTLEGPTAEDAETFRIADAGAGEEAAHSVRRDQVINGPDRKSVTLTDGRTVKLLGMRLDGDVNRHPVVRELLIATSPTESEFVQPSDVAGGFRLDVPQPRVQTGLRSMLRQADSVKLVWALLVAPLPFLFTTYRWRRLLAGLGIGVSFGRAFVLNMVGAFYNTFMPGSTGGDVLKAYYAARQTPDHKTGAVMSVVVDRVLGLIALIILGGTMAAVYYVRSADPHDPVSRACKRVALGAAAILIGSAVGLVLLYTPAVRRQITRVDRFVKSAAYQQLRKVMHVMHAYRQQPGLIAWAVVVTLPVHLTTVISALLAGQAFGLPLSAGYYFVAVPVIVLAGAIPVSPQGVGVMEAFAYYFTRQQGATLNQALALTMSIRLTAVFWNLVGGLFVLRGGFHAPTPAERESVEHDALGVVEPTGV